MTRAASPAARTESRHAADANGVRCWQCNAEQEVAPLCRDCGAVLPLPASADHYQVFGIPRSLNLDAEALTNRYYELSRLLHPDRHATGPAEARAASVLDTAALTRAYRALREPVARALYWLELHGRKLGSNNRVPADLAALVFELQEKLEELRTNRSMKLEAEVRGELAELHERREALLAELQANFRAWDAANADAEALLKSLESILSRRAYLQTLIRDVEAVLNPNG